jgi:K+-sensing histidine kinase KdpD
VNLILELDFQTHEFLSHKILRVTIEDSGIGIPNEARQKLFQPFTQAQRMTGESITRDFDVTLSSTYCALFFHQYHS